MALERPGELIDVAGGRMHLVRRGTKGPAIVLEAGWYGTAIGSWPVVLDRLAQLTTVCAYDRRGYGWSDPPAVPLSLDNVARDLHSCLAGAGVAPPYVLVGHSLGGLYVRRFVELFPDAVCGMVLLDSTHPNQNAEMAAVSGPVFRFLLALQEHAAPLLVGAMMRGSARKLIDVHFPGLDPEERRELLELHMRPSFKRTALAELKSVPREAGTLTRRLPVDIPLLVVAAGKPVKFGGDPIRDVRRRHLEEQVALSSRGELHVLEESGHLVAHDDPHGVVDAIASVLKRVARPN